MVEPGKSTYLCFTCWQWAIVFYIISCVTLVEVISMSLHTSVEHYQIRTRAHEDHYFSFELKYTVFLDYC